MSIQLPDIFSSRTIFRQAFNQGLIKLARQDSLGAFILACVNATTDKALFSRMRDDLYLRYRTLLDQYRQQLLSGRDVLAVDEDLLVFLKLHAMGFDDMQLVDSRQEGLWRLQFNHLRSFRPRRISQASARAIVSPYDDRQFNFNKPFLQKECFWQGELEGRRVDLFYNKYPFADLHGLLVVDKADCLPQYLQASMHQYVFSLMIKLAENVSGLGLGYNSVGAYASVNHLHFQLFVDPQGLPVCDAVWSHNGGTKDYPLNCLAFDTAASSWQFIETLHQLQQPYNLLYCDGRVYVMPRQPQGSLAVPGWSSGFTWYEVAGGMICFNRDDYEALSATDIEAYLAELSVSID